MKGYINHISILHTRTLKRTFNGIKYLCKEKEIFCQNLYFHNSDIDECYSVFRLFILTYKQTSLIFSLKDLHGLYYTISLDRKKIVIYFIELCLLESILDQEMDEGELKAMRNRFRNRKLPFHVCMDLIARAYDNGQTR